MSKSRDRKALSISCPICGSSIGHKCRIQVSKNKDKRIKHPHVQRYHLAKQHNPHSLCLCPHDTIIINDICQYCSFYVLPEDAIRRNEAAHNRLMAVLERLTSPIQDQQD